MNSTIHRLITPSAIISFLFNYVQALGSVPPLVLSILLTLLPRLLVKLLVMEIGRIPHKSSLAQPTAPNSNSRPDHKYKVQFGRDGGWGLGVSTWYGTDNDDMKDK